MGGRAHPVDAGWAAIMLTIRITRVSPTQHRLEYVRADGSGEASLLDTRSFMFHDLLHFAVETEAHLDQSFYGLLARGHSTAALNGKDPADSPRVPRTELAMTESVVGALTGAIKQDTEPARFLDLFQNMLAATEEVMPPFLDEEFVVRVKERLRRLLGQYNGTPFGSVMELHFPP